MLLFLQIHLLIQGLNFVTFLVTNLQNSPVTCEVSVFFLILICTQCDTLNNDDEWWKCDTVCLCNIIIKRHFQSNHRFFLSQEIKHFKQMCGDEAGAAEIKTEGECWKQIQRKLKRSRSRSRGERHTVKISTLGFTWFWLISADQSSSSSLLFLGESEVRRITPQYSIPSVYTCVFKRLKTPQNVAADERK